MARLQFSTGSSGLALPVEAEPAPKARREYENTQPPSVPSDFLRALDDYSQRVGFKYRPRWNARHGIWMVEEQGRDGQWRIVLWVYDEDSSAPLEYEYGFEQLSNLTIQKLYRASLMHRWRTGSSDWDMQLELQAQRSAETLRKERARGAAAEYIGALASDKAPVLARMQSIADYGHMHGAKLFHQVPASMPTGE